MSLTSDVIDGFSVGSDLAIVRTLTDVPDGVDVESARLLVKTNLSDADADALITKTIDATDTADVGQVTNPSSTTAVLTFRLTDAETGVLAGKSWYAYAIRIWLDSGETQVVEIGTMIPSAAGVIATTAPD